LVECRGWQSVFFHLGSDFFDRSEGIRTPYLCIQLYLDSVLEYLRFIAVTFLNTYCNAGIDYEAAYSCLCSHVCCLLALCRVPPSPPCALSSMHPRLFLRRRAACCFIPLPASNPACFLPSPPCPFSHRRPT
jgi:hypothetical protein